MHTAENLKSNRTMKEMINTWNPNIRKTTLKVMIGFSSRSFFFYVHAYVGTIINSLPSLTHWHTRLGIYSRLCPISLSCFIQYDSMICNEHMAIHSFIQYPMGEHITLLPAPFSCNLKYSFHKQPLTMPPAAFTPIFKVSFSIRLFPQIESPIRNQ